MLYPPNWEAVGGSLLLEPRPPLSQPGKLCAAPGTGPLLQPIHGAQLECWITPLYIWMNEWEVMGNLVWTGNILHLFYLILKSLLLEVAVVALLLWVLKN